MCLWTVICSTGPCAAGWYDCCWAENAGAAGAAAKDCALGNEDPVENDCEPAENDCGPAENDCEPADNDEPLAKDPLENEADDPVNEGAGANENKIEIIEN